MTDWETIKTEVNGTVVFVLLAEVKPQLWDWVLRCDGETYRNVEGFLENRLDALARALDRALSCASVIRGANRAPESVEPLAVEPRET